MGFGALAATAGSTRPARHRGRIPASASLRPRRTVSAATPVACATTATPSAPNSAASAPSHNRRWNSDKCGRITAYRRATESAKSAIAQP